MATTKVTWLHHLLIAGTNTDANSYAASSVAATQGRPVYAAFLQRLASVADPAVSTASGTNCFSGTWTSVATVAVNDGSAIGWRLTLFRSTAQAGGAGVLTFDCAAETQSAAAWAILEGVNVSEAPVQSKTAANAASGAALGATLDNALTDERNLVLGVFSCGVSGVTNSPAAGYMVAAGTANWVISASDGISLVLQMGTGLTNTPGYGTRVGRLAIVVELANSNAAILEGTIMRGGGPRIKS